MREHPHDWGNIYLCKYLKTYVDSFTLTSRPAEVRPSSHRPEVAASGHTDIAEVTGRQRDLTTAK
jgi:hypothetical protein